jgi:hypothetical protein
MRWQWALIGLPAMIMVATARGGFNPIPVPPPWFATEHSDPSFSANARWLVAVLVVYGPIALLALAALLRRVRHFLDEDRLGP